MFKVKFLQRGDDLKDYSYVGSERNVVKENPVDIEGAEGKFRKKGDPNTVKEGNLQNTVTGDDRYYKVVSMDEIGKYERGDLQPLWVNEKEGVAVLVKPEVYKEFTRFYDEFRKNKGVDKGVEFTKFIVNYGNKYKVKPDVMAAVNNIFDIASSNKTGTQENTTPYSYKDGEYYADTSYSGRTGRQTIAAHREELTPTNMDNRPELPDQFKDIFSRFSSDKERQQFFESNYSAYVSRNPALRELMNKARRSGLTRDEIDSAKRRYMEEHKISEKDLSNPDIKFTLDMFDLIGHVYGAVDSGVSDKERYTGWKYIPGAASEYKSTQKKSKGGMMTYKQYLKFKKGGKIPMFQAGGMTPAEPMEAPGAPEAAEVEGGERIFSQEDTAQIVQMVQQILQTQDQQQQAEMLLQLGLFVVETVVKHMQQGTEMTETDAPQEQAALEGGAPAGQPMMKKGGKMTYNKSVMDEY
jgi:hypothetical protein